MAVPAGYPTFMDVAKRLDPNGSIAAIIEMLNELNPFVMTGAVFEGNLETGNRTTQRTGLPTAAWRLLNQGVPISKSTTKQIDDTAGMLQSYSEVDVKLANLSSRRAEFLASEDSAFLEAMSQEMEATTIDGDTGVDPEKFLGFGARYTQIQATPNPLISSYNVVNALGDAARSSMWLINWSPNTTYYFYPKGSMMGWNRQFLGQRTASDGAGGQLEVYRTLYSWDLGLTVRDWRSNVRIANIKTSVVPNLEEYMVAALHRRKVISLGGRDAFYCSRKVAEILDIRVLQKSNVWFSMMEWAGKKVVSFRGIPIFPSDSLGDAESAVPVV